MRRPRRDRLHRAAGARGARAVCRRPASSAWPADERRRCSLEQAAALGVRDVCLRDAAAAAEAAARRPSSPSAPAKPACSELIAHAAHAAAAAGGAPLTVLNGIVGAAGLARHHGDARGRRHAGPGQQGEHGRRRAVRARGRPPQRLADPARRQRAQRPLPVPAAGGDGRRIAAASRSSCSPGSGGPFRGRTAADLAAVTPGAGAEAPQLVDGPQDHHRLGHAHEQGPRGHRGALPLRRALRAHHRAAQPAEHRAQHGALRRRRHPRAPRRARHAHAHRLRARLPAAAVAAHGAAPRPASPRQLTFERPDTETFRCLALAQEAGQKAALVERAAAGPRRRRRARAPSARADRAQRRQRGRRARLPRRRASPSPPSPRSSRSASPGSATSPSRASTTSTPATPRRGASPPRRSAGLRLSAAPQRRRTPASRGRDAIMPGEPGSELVARRSRRRPTKRADADARTRAHGRPSRRAPHRAEPLVAAARRRQSSLALVLGQWVWLVAILGLALLITVHEFGHFIAAKAFGMRVEKFYVGFPPAALRRTWGETEYGIGIIPLGGFCKISGMTPEEEVPEGTGDRVYYKKPVWQRNVTIFAGPLMNFVAAAVILDPVRRHPGRPTATLTLDEVVPGSPAAKAGLMAGDTHRRRRRAALDHVGRRPRPTSAPHPGKTISLTYRPPPGRRRRPQKTVERHAHREPAAPGQRLPGRARRRRRPNGPARSSAVVARPRRLQGRRGRHVHRLLVAHQRQDQRHRAGRRRGARRHHQREPAGRRAGLVPVLLAFLSVNLGHHQPAADPAVRRRPHRLQPPRARARQAPRRRGARAHRRLRHRAARDALHLPDVQRRQAARSAAVAGRRSREPGSVPMGMDEPDPRHRRRRLHRLAPRDALLAAGHSVRVLDDFSTGKRENLARRRGAGRRARRPLPGHRGRRARRRQECATPWRAAAPSCTSPPWPR